MVCALFGQNLPFLANGTYAVILFCAGLSIGLTIGKLYIRRIEGERLETRHVIRLLGPLMAWTRSVAADMSQYQAVVGGMAQWLRDKPGPMSEPQRVAAAGLLAQMADANEQLHRRLNQSEMMLQRQADEIATYMSEARTDALTGLPNRRAFDEHLQRSLVEWDRSGRELAIMMVDIDHFKRCNDTYGHPVGDQVLCRVAEALRRTMRASDLVVRLGGEEMSVILPGVGIQAACHAAHRARQSIEQACFQDNGASFRVTVSVGVAGCVRGDTPSRLVRRADEALYAAKQAGRNRVYWHTGTRSVPFEDDARGATDRVEPESVAGRCGCEGIPRGAEYSFAASTATSQPETFMRVCDELRQRLAQVAGGRQGE